jgi:hypothetical protein
MPVVSMLVFVLLEITVAAFVAATTGQLPDRVASHFGQDNFPNGWMPRDAYLSFMVGFALLLPAVVVAGIALTPRLTPRRVNLPHREYWLAPERRAATMTTLSAYACWLGVLIALFIGGIHYSILVANAIVPPRLPAALFWTLLIGFCGALVLWTGALYLRFRNAG